MWVVKVGGSLAGSPLLREWLSLLAEQGGGRIIIVPGGGIFADAVRDMQRRWHYDDLAAHRMALLATEQYGLMLQGLEPLLACAATEEELRGILERGGVPVWLCWPMVINDPSLPRDWSCTSDSLALWLAVRMKAEALLLVKSAALRETGTVSGLSRSGLLDPHFPELAGRYGGAIQWLTATQHGAMRAALRQGALPGEMLVR